MHRCDFKPVVTRHVCYADADAIFFMCHVLSRRVELAISPTQSCWLAGVCKFIPSITMQHSMFQLEYCTQRLRIVADFVSSIAAARAPQQVYINMVCSVLTSLAVKGCHFHVTGTHVLRLQCTPGLLVDIMHRVLNLTQSDLCHYVCSTG